MKIALVHDYLNQYGGAERVLEVLCEIFPDAPIYTLLYDERMTGGVFKGREIHTSFLQKFPFARKHHRIFPILMPLAVEQFDLSYLDVILSVSASFAKGVITKPHTRHINYCLTPTRYLWDDSHRYIDEFRYPCPIRKLVPFFISYLRVWDKEAALRVDKFVGISNFVAARIKKYYDREAAIIYPPVDTSKYFIKDETKSDFLRLAKFKAQPSTEPSHSSTMVSEERRLQRGNWANPRGLESDQALESSGFPIQAQKSEDYFLMVGRLVPYKRFDLAVKVFSAMGKPLKIVGDGPERKWLEKLAGPNVEFLGLVSDYKMPEIYSRAQAVIFPQEEDFGIVPLEAMASGRPVIAYRGGGALETIEEGKTGIFFDDQTEIALAQAIGQYYQTDWNPQAIHAHALKFDKEVFKSKIVDLLSGL